MTAEHCIVTFGEPFGYEELLRDVERLKRKYPFLAVERIGGSVMGKRLAAVRLGTGEKKLFVNGAWHANEWITAPVLLRFVEEAAEAVSKGKMFHEFDPEELFRRVTLWTAPMLNPDGVELVVRGLSPEHPYAGQLLRWNGGSADFTSWKANVRGVDLNDQFPANWEAERIRHGVSGPGPRDYAGEAPLTEPEAAAAAAFTEAHRFDAVIAFHTQGQEIYWNYRNEDPAASGPLAEAMATACGYQAVKLTDSDAGYKDWFIHRWRRPGFTVELGRGVNPLPLSQLPEMYEAASAILRTALLASASSNW